MNDDKAKGALQKAAGHVEESAGALVGDHDLKATGQKDQIKGGAREALGDVKDAGNKLVDRAKGNTAEVHTTDAAGREHDVVVKK